MLVVVTAWCAVFMDFFERLQLLPPSSLPPSLPPSLSPSHQDIYTIVMEYITKEHFSLLNTVDDISVWTLGDLKVCKYKDDQIDNYCNVSRIGGAPQK